MTVFLAGIIDPRLDVTSSRLAVPSLLVGMSVAGLILGGVRLWPGIYLGTLVGTAVLLDQPWLYGIYYGADTTFAALIILGLLSHWRFSRAFDQWQDPLLLFGAAIVGGGVIQALDFVGLMTYQWQRPGELAPSGNCPDHKRGRRNSGRDRDISVRSRPLVDGLCRRCGFVRPAAGCDSADLAHAAG